MTPRDSDDSLVLYVLVRNDLASLNPGKAAAQGNHAGTMASWMLRTGDDQMRADLHAWEAQTGSGFGIVKTLELDGNELERRIENARKVGLVASTVLDPTYPLRDGDVLHLIPLVTCGFVFARRSVGEMVLGDLPWMS